MEQSLTMQEAANELMISKTQLFTILKRYGIIADKKPRNEFILMGYMGYESKTIVNGQFNKTVPVVFITKKGIKWLSKFLKLMEVKISGWI